MPHPRQCQQYQPSSRSLQPPVAVKRLSSARTAKEIPHNTAEKLAKDSFTLLLARTVRNFSFSGSLSRFCRILSTVLVSRKNSESSTALFKWLKASSIVLQRYYLGSLAKSILILILDLAWACEVCNLAVNRGPRGKKNLPIRFHETVTRALHKKINCISQH